MRYVSFDCRRGEMKKLVFRVDSSPGLGTGHLRRCLTLASTAQQIGHESFFVMSRPDPHAERQLRRFGFEFAYHGHAPTGDWSLSHNPDWTSEALHHQELLDARATSGLLKSVGCDLLVLDHYFLGQDWINEIRRAFSIKTLVLDDVRRDWTSIDFLSSTTRGGVKEFPPSDVGRSLIGPRYAILGEEYRRLRSTASLSPLDRENITIFVSGSDSGNLTQRFLDAVTSVISPELRLSVVIGAHHPFRDSLSFLVDRLAGATLFEDLPSLGPLFAESRLSLGAAGTTSWERACLGVPSVVTAIAENQDAVCVELETAHAALVLPRVDDTTMSHVRERVLEFVSNGSELNKMADRARIIVDGYGTLRLLEATAPGPGSVTIREVTRGDREILYDWANDSVARENSLSQTAIDWSTHVLWFEEVVLGKRSHLFLLELDGLPVGQIRFDRGEDHWRLSYSVDRDFRGRGLGKSLVELGLRSLPTESASRVRAEVKRMNRASMTIFPLFGFTETSESTDELAVFSLVR
jgi:UDP-2,4-diacetamido-2,4,6-trideoxy-beta-L-altropyranose hydrolase